MGRFKNLSGQTFGWWTVIERAEDMGGRHPRWNCRCRCGREIDVQASNLVSGLSKRCAFCSRQIQAMVKNGFSREDAEEAVLSRIGKQSDLMTKAAEASQAGISYGHQAAQELAETVKVVIPDNLPTSKAQTPEIEKYEATEGDKTMENEMEMLKKQNDELKEMHKRLIEKNEELLHENADRAERIGTLEGDRKKLEADLLEADRRRSELAEENIRLKNALNLSTDKAKDLDKRLDAQRVRAEKAECERETMLKNFQATIGRQDQRIGFLNQLVDEMFDRLFGAIREGGR